MAHIENLPTKALRFAAQNPNHMSERDQRTLDNAVKIAHKKGLTGPGVSLLQSLLVRKVGDTYEVIDGAHRLNAARTNGLDTVPCIVIECDNTEAKKLQIGMNRLRGVLDMADVGTILADLNLDSASPDLALTGYAVDEIASLLRLAEAADGPDPDAFEEEDMPGADPEAPDTAKKPWTIELSFASKEDRDKVQKALRKAAGGGRGADLAAGALRLVEGLDHAQVR